MGDVYPGQVLRLVFLCPQCRARCCDRTPEANEAALFRERTRLTCRFEVRVPLPPPPAGASEHERKSDAIAAELRKAVLRGGLLPLVPASGALVFAPGAAATAAAAPGRPVLHHRWYADQREDRAEEDHETGEGGVRLVGGVGRSPAQPGNETRDAGAEHDGAEKESGAADAVTPDTDPSRAVAVTFGRRRANVPA